MSGPALRSEHEPPDVPQYLWFIGAESARFREVLAGVDPAAPVPSCPGVGRLRPALPPDQVQCFWAWVVGQPARRAPRTVPRPSGRRATPMQLSAFDEASAGLVAALRDADPADPAWTWSKEQTVGFTFRRQAHEALIHRLDAELTARAVTDLDAALAADGVDEVLDVMFGGLPAWGAFSPLAALRAHRPHRHRRPVWVQLGRFSGTDPEGESHEEEDIHVVADPGVEPDAVISAPAGVLDARLWRRGDGDSGRRR